MQAKCDYADYAGLGRGWRGVHKRFVGFFSHKTLMNPLTTLPDFTIIGSMTLFEDDRYDWLETYFVCFESAHRPKLPEIRRALKTYAPFFCVLDSKADPNGNLVAMTIASYENHAALEIVYREGKEVVSEIQHLVRSLKKEATATERSKLQRIVQCKTRFDVHHFEQTAETGVFNITKLPELKFARQSTVPVERGDVFLKALGQGKAGSGRFHFDPDSYDRCRTGLPSEELDIADASAADSGEFERINPEMLVTVLEILCRISRGVALDPASGIVL